MADPLNPVPAHKIAPAKVPEPITQNDIDRARDQKQSAVVSGLLTFLTPGALVVGAGIQNTFLGRLALGAGGLHPTAPGSTLAVKPGLFALTYALPSPLGVIPPEEYRIPPDYLSKRVGEFRGAESLGLHSTSERERVHAAREYARKLQEFYSHFERAERSPVVIEVLLRDVQFLRETAPLIPQSALALPTVERLLATEAALPPTTRELVGIPSASSAPDETFPPMKVQPGNITAQANADKAQGISQELVTERADP